MRVGQEETLGTGDKKEKVKGGSKSNARENLGILRGRVEKIRGVKPETKETILRKDRGDTVVGETRKRFETDKAVSEVRKNNDYFLPRQEKVRDTEKEKVNSKLTVDLTVSDTGGSAIMKKEPTSN